MRGNVAANLVDFLALLTDRLQSPLGSPRLPEHILLPGPQLEDWLATELASRLGVCCNVLMYPPEQMLARVGGKVSRAFRPWYVAGVLADCAAEAGRQEAGHQEAGFDEIGRYLEDDDSGLRRMQLARVVSDLFGRYCRFRPEMVRVWSGRSTQGAASGRDGAAPAEGARASASASGGDSGSSSADHWQARLWRILTRQRPDPVALQDEFVARIEDASLPERLTLFGVWYLAPLEQELLLALDPHVDIRILAIEGSPLAQWLEGTDSLQGAERLQGAEGAEGAETAEGVEDLEGVEGREGPGAEIEQLAGGKNVDGRSISIHACHHPQREVEVLRDALLARFEVDPSLEPEDVLVLAPDVNIYAPHIAAVFRHSGDIACSAGARARIPYCVADRTSLAGDPALGAFLKILTLAGGRRPRSAVIEVLTAPPVRLRFGLSAGQVELVDAWLEQAAVRWGEDGPARTSHGNPPFPEHSWRWGLDRMLLGYAMEDVGEEGEVEDREAKDGEAEDGAERGGEFRDSETPRLFGGLLPLGGIEGPDAQILGSFCAFCDTLFSRLSVLEESRPVARWRELLIETYDALLVDWGEWAHSREALLKALGELEGDDEVGAVAITDWLTTHLESSGRRGRFYAGGVTFASLGLGQAIPARVVALLGMDHESFPRDPVTQPFDLLASDPRPGELPPRELDRLTFSAALLAAREHLHISYVGLGMRDNQPLPPSAFVAELLDRMGPERAGRAHRQHPLQPFSPANFGVAGEAFSASWHAGAEALLARRRREAAGGEPADDRGPLVARPLVEAPLPPLPPEEPVSLGLLIRFFRNPPAALLSERIDLRLPEEEEAPSDREPFSLGGLERWSAGERILRALLDGCDPEQVYAAMQAEGVLPVGTPGRIAFDACLMKAAAVADAARACDAGEHAGDLDVDLKAGSFHLTGRLDAVHRRGCRHVSYGRLTGARLLAGWIKHVVAVADGRLPHRSWMVGRGSDGRGEVLVWGQAGDARQILARLLGIYAEGRSRPIEFIPQAAYAYVYSKHVQEKGHETAVAKAQQAWLGTSFGAVRIPGEGEDAAVARVFGIGMLETDAFVDFAESVYLPLFSAIEPVGGAS